MELDIVRAWKDKQYRDSLSAEQKALLPKHPIGFAELSEEELDQVIGGFVVESAATTCAGCGCTHHC